MEPKLKVILCPVSSWKFFEISLTGAVKFAATATMVLSLAARELVPITSEQQSKRSF